MGAERPARAAVRAAVRAALADLGPGERVLVALSGGPDSLALLAATTRVAAEGGLVCAAVVVDHGLQPGSAAVAARAEQARILGCAGADVVRVRVAQGPGAGGPEAAARTVRYAALQRAASDPPATAVLLGHTRDDQAETVLLGLARGSGVRSLAGMAPRSGLWRRPLLELPRELVARARGVLVFPAVLEAGFIVGASRGDGALRVGGKTVSYHRTTAGSIGLQAGAQSTAMFILFMTEDALRKFQSSRGWTAGVDASVTMISVGASAQMTTATAQQPVIGYVLSNSGLMAGVTVNGARVTSLKL